ncbi:hypothetical protein M0812_02295 [Anaeramoeba flamelloides]|uniref:Uncharacterized protein n=1 Tax=Anaeramoeba flamelloides TaxID=1746091 RepID=A0AAV7Z056_9EUKA|nr:hypothetical protein M0812_02295 [Anaeramoeba flamelloides]
MTSQAFNTKNSKNKRPNNSSETDSEYNKNNETSTSYSTSENEILGSTQDHIASHSENENPLKRDQSTSSSSEVPSESDYSSGHEIIEVSTDDNSEIQNELKNYSTHINNSNSNTTSWSENSQKSKKKKRVIQEKETVIEKETLKVMENENMKKIQKKQLTNNNNKNYFKIPDLNKEKTHLKDQNHKNEKSRSRSKRKSKSKSKSMGKSRSKGKGMEISQNISISSSEPEKERKKHNKKEKEIEIKIQIEKEEKEKENPNIKSKEIEKKKTRSKQSTHHKNKSFSKHKNKTEKKKSSKKKNSKIKHKTHIPEATLPNKPKNAYVLAPNINPNYSTISHHPSDYQARSIDDENYKIILKSINESNSKGSKSHFTKLLNSTIDLSFIISNEKVCKKWIQELETNLPSLKDYICKYLNNDNKIKKIRISLIVYDDKGVQIFFPFDTPIKEMKSKLKKIEFQENKMPNLGKLVPAYDQLLSFNWKSPIRILIHIAGKNCRNESLRNKEKIKERFTNLTRTETPITTKLREMKKIAINYFFGKINDNTKEMLNSISEYNEKKEFMSRYTEKLSIGQDLIHLIIYSIDLSRTKIEENINWRIKTIQSKIKQNMSTNNFHHKKSRGSIKRGKLASKQASLDAKVWFPREECKTLIIPKGTRIINKIKLEKFKYRKNKTTIQITKYPIEYTKYFMKYYINDKESKRIYVGWQPIYGNARKSEDNNKFIESFIKKKIYDYFLISKSMAEFNYRTSFIKINIFNSFLLKVTERKEYSFFVDKQ